MRSIWCFTEHHNITCPLKVTGARIKEAGERWEWEAEMLKWEKRGEWRKRNDGRWLKGQERRGKIDNREKRKLKREEQKRKEKGEIEWNGREKRTGDLEGTASSVQ